LIITTASVSIITIETKLSYSNIALCKDHSRPDHSLAIPDDARQIVSVRGKEVTRMREKVNRGREEADKAKG